MKFVLLFWSFIIAFSAGAQKEYEINYQKEGVFLGSAALLLGGSLYLDGQSDPLILPPLGSAPPLINSLDRSALDNYSLLAKDASDFLFYGLSVLPASMMFSHKLAEDRLAYLLMYGEVVALNGGLTLFVKSLAQRKRPYFYNEAASDEERQSMDASKSFFSGHTSHTAALCFFTARVFTDLHDDSEWESLVWTGAAVLPAITGYLRVRAGRHFPSDVLVGYGVGAGIGLLIPLLHRTKSLEDHVIEIIPMGQGLMLRYQF